MVKCTAFTIHRRRCLNPAKTNGTCSKHALYYTNWFTTHPPPLGFRLNIEEKPEYKFQIENGYVSIDSYYLKSLNHREEADYYEYLLHLPYIKWDVNMKMVLFLILQFLNQHDFIPITRYNLESYFSNMFGNPSFCAGTFIMRLLYIIDERKLIPTLIPYLTDNRILDILRCIIDHPVFEGFMYMNWLDEIKNQLSTSSSFIVFAELVQQKKIHWQNEKINSERNDELLKIAMNPSRLLNWYVDTETRKEILQLFPCI